MWWEKAMAGSKGKPCECGLVSPTEALSQRESRGSVVWWGKAMAGSKGNALECGLVSPTEALSQRGSVGVWSGKPNRRPGQREKRWSVV